MNKNQIILIGLLILVLSSSNTSCGSSIATSPSSTPYSPPTLPPRTTKELMDENTIPPSKPSPSPTHTEPKSNKEVLQLTYAVEKSYGKFALNAVTIECADEAPLIISDPVELFEWPIQDSYGLFGFSWSPEGANLAYSAIGMGDSVDIFIIDQNGENKINITHSPVDEWDPSWSPDGSKIVYTLSTILGSLLYWSSLDGSDGGEFLYHGWDDIYVDSPQDPGWSNNGDALAFIAYVDLDDHTYQVMVSNPDGTSITQITNSYDSSYAPSFSPDGSWLVTSRDLGDPTEYGGGHYQSLFLIRSDGTDEYMLIGDPSEDYIAPSWSPICNLIAFEHIVVRESQDIYLIKHDGTNLINVTNRPNTRQWFPQWRVVTKP